jgi:hypothetical protein
MLLDINMLDQKGVSLFLAIMVMSILSAVSLGLISISISGIKIAKGLENSVMSFYAANTGIEHSLYDIRKNGVSGVGGIVSGTLLEGEVGYDVSVDVALITTIKSVGTYRDTRRAIQVSY